MPFKSKSQMRAAFGGYLGAEMKSKAKTWAAETPNIKKLPMKKHMMKMDKEDKADMKKGMYSKKEEKAEKFKGKGTKARLNTAAEKNFFKSKMSK